MKRIGIVCALHIEASCFMQGKLPARQPVRLNERTFLILSGMGRDRAKRAAQTLVEENVDCLVSFGTAGALSPALRPGDLVLPQEIVFVGKSEMAGLINQDTDGQEVSGKRSIAVAADTADSGLQEEQGPDETRKYVVTADLPAQARQRLSRQNIPVHTGPLACTDEAVSSSAGKRRLFEQTGAIAVDMESAGVLETAQENGLQGYAARVIVDPADLALPEIVLRRVDDYGRLNGLALGLRLVTSPGQIPDIVRLAKASRQAGKTMRLVARELLDNGLHLQSPFSGLSKSPN